MLSCSMALDSSLIHRLGYRILCPCNFPGSNTGVGCHFLKWLQLQITKICSNACVNTPLLRNNRKLTPYFVCFLSLYFLSVLVGF